MVKRECAQVSSLGRFRSTYGTTSTPAPEWSGYVRVKIDKKRYSIHRLIAAAFGLPRATEDASEVNHINLNRSDNRVENLEYVTRAANVLHSWRLNPTRSHRNPLQSKPLRGRACGGTEGWATYLNAREAAEALGLAASAVSQCCNRKRASTQGYEFEFVVGDDETLENEEWRLVRGTGAHVSSLGRYRNSRGVTYQPNPRCDGYVTVRTGKAGYLMHRLVAVAFDLPRAPGADQVNHKNGQRDDNRVANLEWVTVSQNVRESYANNPLRKSSAYRTSKPVRGRKRGDEAWTAYPSANEAARVLGLGPANVSGCCTGKHRRIGGYEFEYDAPNEPDTLEGEEWRDVVREEAPPSPSLPFG